MLNYGIRKEKRDEINEWNIKNNNKMKRKQKEENMSSSSNRQEGKIRGSRKE